MYLGGLVIFIKIHPKADPNMNVARIFTGMNHLNDNKKCHNIVVELTKQTEVKNQYSQLNNTLKGNRFGQIATHQRRKKHIKPKLSQKEHRFQQTAR